MTDSATIQLKTGLPSLPGVYLPRERLDHRWTEWESQRLVVVEAGAGYGKTTLLAANAARSSRRLFWYTFDSLDLDLSGVAIGLAGAFGIELGDIGLAPGSNPERPMTALLVALIQRIQQSREEWNLVLDDFHCVQPLTAVRDFVEVLARHLPAGNTLFLAGRGSLGIRAGRLRALGSSSIVASRELLFTRDETGDLFRRAFPELDAGGRDLDRIARRTEGWAAGLGICLQYAQSSRGPWLQAILSGLDSAGPDWFSYFAEEVLDALDARTQDFLLRTSILPRLDPSLCDRVLSIRNSRRLLEDLHHRNLFTFPLPGSEGAYRYHQLFQAFLQRTLRAREDDPQMRALLRRTGRILASDGAWIEAAVALAEAGDARSALRVLETHGRELLGAGEYGRILKVFESIDAAEFEKRPKSLFVLGRVHDAQGRWDEAKSIYLRAIRRRPPVPLRVELLSLVAQIESRRGAYAEAIRICRRAMDTPGWTDRGTWGRLYGTLGVSAAEQGDLAGGEKYLSAAAAAFSKANDIAGEGRIHYLMAINIWHPRGEFRLAKDAARRALVLFQRVNDSRRICYSLGVLGFVTVASGEEREGRQLSEDALRRAEALELRGMEGLCHVSLGYCALLRNDPADAKRHFEVARQLGSILGETDLLTYPHLGLAEAALAQANPHAARVEATAALRAARRTKDLLQEAQACTLLGLCDLSKRNASARAWWRKSESILRRIGASYELHRLILHRIEAHGAADAEMPRLMEELLTGTARMQHESLYLVAARPRAARVLAAALRFGIEREFASGLLVRLGEEAVEELKKMMDDPSLSDLAIRLLGRIGGDRALHALMPFKDPTTRIGRLAQRAWEDLSHRPDAALRIETLGPFTVAAGNLPLTREMSRSKRSLRLFLYLLLRQHQWVPRDEILEALWPGEDPVKAANNLTQSIFLLRKALQPELRTARFSSYILFRDEACRLEVGEGAYHDARIFEEKVAKAEECRRVGREREAEAELREALALYRSDFCAEFPYEEILAEERERLRDRMLAATRRYLEVLAASQKWVEVSAVSRTGLARDPYSEDFHRHLVQALLQVGNRPGALEAYHRYEEVIQRDLGLLPSARMRTLLDRVANTGRNQTGDERLERGGNTDKRAGHRGAPTDA